MTKWLAAAFGLGAALPLLVALSLGGEGLVQAGLRLVAIEQGFALAGRHWQFTALPEHQAEQVAYVEEDGPAPKPAKPRRK